MCVFNICMFVTLLCAVNSQFSNVRPHKVILQQRNLLNVVLKYDEHVYYFISRL